MQGAERLTIEQIRHFLAGSDGVLLKALDREETYRMDRVYA